MGRFSKKIWSLETDLSSLIALATIVFSLLKVTRGLKILPETGPLSSKDKAMEKKMWLVEFTLLFPDVRFFFVDCGQGRVTYKLYKLYILIVQSKSVTNMMTMEKTPNKK